MRERAYSIVNHQRRAPTSYEHSPPHKICNIHQSLSCHRPIPVVQSDHPSDEYVDSLHAELLRRVEELYYKHRPDWETRVLVIS